MNLLQEEQVHFWDKFALLGNFFKRQALTEKEQKRKEKQMSLQKKANQRLLHNQVNELLDGELYDVVFTMMKNGYTLDKDQYKKMSDALYTYVHEKKMDEIHNWMKKGWQISLNDTIFFLLSNDYYHQFKHLISAQNLPEENHLLERQLYQQIHSPDFQQQFFKTWKEHLNLISEFSQDSDVKLLILIVRNHHDVLFAHIKSMPDFVKLCKYYSEKINTGRFFDKLGDSYIQNEVMFMGNLVQEYFPDGVRKLFKDTQQYFSQEKLEQLVHTEQQRIIQKQHIHTLPQEAIQIINKIEEHYQQILPHIDSFKSEEFDIHNIIEKRLPEVLNKYLSIHEDYRNSLVNSNGKNAKDLMLDSLNNFESYFLDMAQQVNESKLHSLSASEKYSQQFKK